MSYETENNSLNINYRTEELKQFLNPWRHILLPLNNLLEWKHKYDPLIIFAVLTSIFSCIYLINPSVLTSICCIILMIAVLDLLASNGIEIFNKNWLSIDDEKYSRLCERIADFERYIKQKYQSTLKIRQERPIMYLMIGGIFLSFLAICSQHIDNLLLIYLTILCLCLAPGLYNFQYNSKIE